MWNNTETPLAYLITFRCYGTWLHGDERGSIDRFHNRYKSSYIPQDKVWHEHNKQQLKRESVILSSEQRKSVEDSIRETCRFRKWLLHAVNVRTNHVHAVITASSAQPERVLNDLKSYATRKLKQNDCWQFEYSPWADKGSQRRLWNEQSVANAVDYVVNGQGDDLPDFDYRESIR